MEYWFITLYQSKNGRQTKTYDALEWLAAMCTHVPNRGEQMIRYYDHYSNSSRGKRKKEDRDDVIPHIIEEDGISPEKRKAWARLIQKIYEVNPLTCPQCQGTMKIIAFIEQAEVIVFSINQIIPTMRTHVMDDFKSIENSKTEVFRSSVILL